MCIQGTRGILNGRCSIPRIVGKQGCVPGVAIVICIKGTGDILNDIEYSWLTAMCTCGRHLNTYPRYTRYIEWTYFIVGKQRCVPWVFISTCIQGTRDILNGHSI